MRGIKFRAWHSGQNKMYSADELGTDQLTLSVDGRGFVNVSGDALSKSEFIPSMIPEQFTGLRDKNGVEIYEGDIIKYNDSMESGTATVGNYIGNNLYFEWHKSPLPPTNADIFGCSSELEILGNIHQNPELLK